MQFAALYEQYSKVLPITKDHWKLFENITKPMAVSKGSVFVNPGDKVTQFGVILKGIFKLSYVGEDKNECVKCFREEGQLITPYAEYIQNVPSRTMISAIEDSQILVVQFSDFENLLKSTPEWMGLKLKITEEHYIIKDRREYDFLMRSALERYEELAAESPKLIERVPQYLIANYLGITPVALSRILSTKKK